MLSGKFCFFIAIFQFNTNLVLTAQLVKKYITLLLQQLFYATN